MFRFLESESPVPESLEDVWGVGVEMQTTELHSGRHSWTVFFGRALMSRYGISLFTNLVIKFL